LRSTKIIRPRNVSVTGGFSTKENVILEESFSNERLTWISKGFLLNDNHPWLRDYSPAESSVASPLKISYLSRNKFSPERAMDKS